MTANASSIANTFVEARWRRAALDAPAAWARRWLLRLGGAAVAGLGLLLLLGVARMSLYMHYAPAMLVIGLHAAAVLMACVVPRSPTLFVRREIDGLAGGRPLNEHLLRQARRTEDRVRLLRRVRRAVAIEVFVLFLFPIVRSALSDAPLRWWWPFTVATAVLLIIWPVERVLMSAARERRRMGELVLTEQP